LDRGAESWQSCNVIVEERLFIGGGTLERFYAKSVS